MSALAHFLEDDGLSTVVISLVRLHSEKIRPPRSLFVPFELGRPLGPPDDPGGQKKVLSEALALLTHNGPGPLLKDFPDPDRLDHTTGWQPPVASGDAPPLTISGAALKTEFALLEPGYLRFSAERNRTSFGVSGFSRSEVIAHFARLLDGVPTGAPRLFGKQLKFIFDDLKILYFESACAGTTAVPSDVLNTWFWRNTVAGQGLYHLRQEFTNGQDKGRKLITGFMVPGEWVDKLGQE